jgi:hypothetical protein
MKEEMESLNLKETLNKLSGHSSINVATQADTVLAMLSEIS